MKTALRAHNKMTHCLILTDCSNLLSSVSNIAARCIGRCAKLHMAYIRDALAMLSLSFACGPLDIADVGTKVNPNVGIYKKLATGGTFEIAFLTRKEIKEMLDRRKTDREIRDHRAKNTLP